MKQALLELVRQKRPLLTILAVLLTLNLGIYLVYNYYLTPAIVTSQVSWNSLRQRVLVAGRSDVASIYRRGVDDLKILSAKVPAKRQFVRVLGELLDSASSSGVVTGAVTYRPQAVKGQDLLAYSVSVSVSGSYAAVKSFLGDLQKNGEMIVVDSISMSNTDLFEENVAMDLKLSIYLQQREGA